MLANVRMQFLSRKDYKAGNALRAVRYIFSECDWKTQAKNTRDSNYPISINTRCPVKHVGIN